MASMFRRTLTFAAGALTAPAAVVRVHSDVAALPSYETTFAVLAEGTRWEVRVGFKSTWYIDVPEHCRNLSPADRMVAVDKIMRRLADGPPVVSPAPRLAQDKPRFVSRRPELRIAYDHA